MNQLRTVFTIQILNSFASGLLGVALPLMMEARAIDVVVIGLVFSSMPLVMQFGRMFFATVSDFWGRKLFFLSSGLLGMISGGIYYMAATPLEFLFGKLTEGTREGTLWAVNRAYMLEKSENKLKGLVYLRAVVYVAYAVGSLAVGLLVLWFAFEGIMLLCALMGLSVVFLSVFLSGEKREPLNMGKALRFMDFRRKERVFKIFLVLFFVMGLAFGFIGGYVFPVFLSVLGFNAEAIGLIFGVQIMLAGVFSYLFSRAQNVRGLLLFSGALFSATFLVLGFANLWVAVGLVLFAGVVEGIAAIGQEGILSRITGKGSYGTDIGLLMTGLHIGETISLALSGFLIARFGFAAPFVLSALTYALFCVGAYLNLKE